jgi:hypothetical protein
MEGCIHTVHRSSEVIDPNEVAEGGLDLVRSVAES